MGFQRESLDDPLRFEWDENKRQKTLETRGIDFVGAVRIFRAPFVRTPSNRSGEERWLAIGAVEGITLAVVYTWRGMSLRIISARRARADEERAYNQHVSGGGDPPEG